VNNEIQQTSNLKTSDNLIAPLAASYLWSDYYETNRSQNYLGTVEAVSNPLGCSSGLTSCTLSVSFSQTKTEQFTASIDYTLKSKIKALVGAAWISSATTTTTYSFTMAAGKTATVMFAPYYIYSSGSGTTWWTDGVNTLNLFNGYVYGMTPKKLSTGELSGIVYANVSG